MKTAYRYFYIAPLLLWVLFTSCKEEVDCDELRPFGGVVVCFEVTDSETGSDLLDQEIEGNIVSDYIRALHEGQSYYIRGAEDGYPNLEREPDAEDDRFRPQYKKNPREYGQVRIGPFYTDTDGVEFSLDWNDGVVDQVRVISYPVEERRGYIEVWVNGEPCKDLDTTFPFNVWYCTVSLTR